MKSADTGSLVERAAALLPVSCVIEIISVLSLSWHSSLGSRREVYIGVLNALLAGEMKEEEVRPGYMSPLVKQDLAKLEKEGDSRRVALHALKQIVENMEPTSVPRFLAQVRVLSSAHLYCERAGFLQEGLNIRFSRLKLWC